MTKEAKRIVAALRVVCDERSCEGCPCSDWCHKRKVNCLDDDAADLIESLSATCDQLTDALKTRGFENIEAVFAEMDQVKRERDAAVEDLKEADLIDCMHCKAYEKNAIPCQCDCEDCKIVNCVCKTCVRNSNWQWRGVREKGLE